MNKEQLVQHVQSEANITKKDAEKAVNAVVGAIHSAFETGEKLAIQGLGSFETRVRSARTGRHPQTGEPINLPASRVPVFKPGKTSKDKANAPKA